MLIILIKKTYVNKVIIAVNPDRPNQLFIHLNAIIDKKKNSFHSSMSHIYHLFLMRWVSYFKFWWGVYCKGESLLKFLKPPCMLRIIVIAVAVTCRVLIRGWVLEDEYHWLLFLSKFLFTWCVMYLMYWPLIDNWIF